MVTRAAIRSISKLAGFRFSTLVQPRAMVAPESLAYIRLEAGLSATYVYSKFKFCYRHYQGCLLLYSAATLFRVKSTLGIVIARCLRDVL